MVNHTLEARHHYLGPTIGLLVQQLHGQKDPETTQTRP